MNPIYTPSSTSPPHLAVRERIGCAVLAMRLGEVGDASALLADAKEISEKCGCADNAAIQRMTLESLK